jgi:hypothetical protein
MESLDALKGLRLHPLKVCERRLPLLLLPPKALLQVRILRRKCRSLLVHAPELLPQIRTLPLCGFELRPEPTRFGQAVPFERLCPVSLCQTCLPSRIHLFNPMLLGYIRPFLNCANSCLCLAMCLLQPRVGLSQFALQCKVSIT